MPDKTKLLEYQRMEYVRAIQYNGDNADEVIDAIMEVQKPFADKTPPYYGLFKVYKHDRFSASGHSGSIRISPIHYFEPIPDGHGVYDGIMCAFEKVVTYPHLLGRAYIPIFKGDYLVILKNGYEINVLHAEMFNRRYTLKEEDR